jgi:hypothetical protein
MHEPVGEAPAEVTRGLRRAGTQRQRAIEAAEQITGGGVEARFRRCRGPELQRTAREASRGRGGASTGDVVVRSAAEQPIDGEAEAPARRREEGGGGASDAGLGLGFRWVGAALCRVAEPHWCAGPGKEDRRRSRGPLRTGEEGGEEEEDGGCQVGPTSQRDRGNGDALGSGKETAPTRGPG